MKIGPKRHSVGLYSASTSTDSFGEPIETYASYDTVWASIKPLSGKEYIHAQQQQAEVSHKVTIRYHASVTEKHRVYFGSRVLEIVFINDIDERNHFQEMLCKEIK